MSSQKCAPPRPPVPVQGRAHSIENRPWSLQSIFDPPKHTPLWVHGTWVGGWWGWGSRVFVHFSMFFRNTHKNYFSLDWCRYRGVYMWTLCLATILGLPAGSSILLVFTHLHKNRSLWVLPFSLQHSPSVCKSRSGFSHQAKASH